ncbi:MAG: glycosyltransferase family 4 protein [Clostridium butyricum]|nr:glycosyltransferase family 4 protein [Clostridium butyricum]MDU4802754.1 glycosyltransferase family 4 protein [Clostridium butyricum]
MKKILYLHAGAELYGADIVLLELLKNIDKKKFEPLVILPCEGPLVEKLKENNIKVKVIEYPILRRKYFTPFGILNYIRDYFKYSKEIKKIVEKNNIDIVHTNTAAVLEGVYVKQKIKTIKHIWHIHEIIVKPPIIHKFLSFIISRFSDEVVVVSNAVKKHLMDTGYFKKEIKVIYNGVDNKIFNPNNNTEYIRKEFNIPKDSIVVGMIGRINAWKGQKDFLLAMDKVLKKNNNVYAMMVGGVFEGEEWRKKELEEQIKNMENKDRIVFSDYRKDTPNIHCLYDIFVLPSTNPDPLPTVVLEAMASGKPVVGYRHGGVCEMVSDKINGLLVENNNYNYLATNIEELINNKEMIEKMSLESLERQKKFFSTRSYKNNFENVYSNL